MKKHLWIVMICVLAGCSPSLTTPTVVSLPSPSPTSIETAILPTATSQVTPQFPTLTPHPTLNPDEISLLLKFLRNEPPCQLPCWGGITPGKSTVTEAQIQLTSLSGFSDHVYFGLAYDSWVVGTLKVYYPLNNTVVGIRPGYVALRNNEKVSIFSLYAQSFPKNPKGLLYGDKEYNALLSAYSMPEILSTYGSPNIIYTIADTHPVEVVFIRLLYLDRGIFISYEMPMDENGGAFKFCPSKSVITLDLTPPEIGENYQEFFRQVGDEGWASLPMPHYQLLEDALGITNEEFSRAIISSPETCFETPSSIWPDP